MLNLNLPYLNLSLPLRMKQNGKTNGEGLLPILLVFYVMGFNYISFDDKNKLSKKKIIIKGILFYLKYLFVLICVILSLIVALNLFNVDTGSLKYPLESEMNEMREKSDFYLLFLVVFFGSIIEEMGFRLGFSFKRKHIAISASAITYMFTSLLSGSGYFDDVLYKLVFAALTGLILYGVGQTIYDNIQQKYGQIIIWIMILFFGFLHVINYDIEVTCLLPMYFVMCLPQVLMGIVFTYFRLNLGFLYGLGFHCLLNGISFMLSSLLIVDVDLLVYL